MESINIYFGGIGLSLFGVVYVMMIVVMYYMRKRFSLFPTEPVGILCNGAIGMTGYFLYILNVPLTGRINSLFVLVPSICRPLCDDDQSKLATYAVVSTIRFVCWYLEAIISFLYISVFLGRPVTMILIRYGMHTLNFLLSLASFVIASDKDFPNAFIVGGSAFSPIIMQTLLLLFVLLSYASILTSNLYRLPWDPILKGKIRKILLRQREEYGVNS